MKKLFIAHLVRVFLMFQVIFSNQLNAQMGIVITPVADLLGQPMSETFKHKDIIQAYGDLAWSAKGTDYAACPRIMQLLFNEIIEIIEVKDHEVKVVIPHVFYQTNTSNTTQNEYWMLKKDIVFFSELIKNNIPAAYFPVPINFKTKDMINANRNTIGLVEPFHAKETKTTYSAGTRFVKSDNQSKKDKVSVYVYDPKSQKVKIISIPKKITWEITSKKPSEYLNDFVFVLRKWVNQSGTIPYTWGGCSFSNTLTSNIFHEEYMTLNNKRLCYYVRPQKVANPKAGFDCSSIIVRAAQLVGIPYFFKNTYTLAKNIAPLAEHESIENGDLIWVRGHVLVVSDREKNTIIQARPYDDGYGEIQETPLSAFFNKINTFDELKAAYLKKQPIERLNKQGFVCKKYQNCKLLKMASLWS